MKIQKPRRWAFLYGLVLTAFTAYVLLDAFVIPRSYTNVQSLASGTSLTTQVAAAENVSLSSNATITEDSYDDGNISIQLTEYEEYDTKIYVADVTLASADSLKTAFANGTFGKNIKQTTSAMASANQAILAINGDYYGTRNGYVIRNGVLYRSTSAGSDQQDLVIYADGSFAIITEGDVTAQALLDQGAQQVLSFGPALLENGQVTVDTNAEVDQAKTSNPRTAIGIIDSLHYVFVVADGRTTESQGLSLYQLAQFMQSLGVQTAYNLDGGGSSTMVFNGEIINNPTTNGNTITERKVSDIVYIG